MANLMANGGDNMLSASGFVVSRQEPPAGSSSLPTTTTAALSTGAIAGIAVGGAALLFAALAPLLLKLARRQDRRRRARVSALSAEGGVVAGLEDEDLDEMDVNSGVRRSPRRLRKKSVTSDRGGSVVVVVDKEDDVGREESHNSSRPSSSTQQQQQRGSPTRTRPRTTSGGHGGEGGGGMVRIQKQRSPEKQRGYGLYEQRRTASWIDEDAIHGPTMTSPVRQKKKNKEKHRRQFSWLGSDGGLGRSLSRLSIKSGTTGRMGSPTLPYTEGGGEQQRRNTAIEARDERDARHNSTQIVRPDRYTLAVQLSRPQSQQQQVTYTSPQKAYAPPISLPHPGVSSHNPAWSPPDIIQNPRFRNRVSFQAAHQLAGGARLPVPVSIPQLPPSVTMTSMAMTMAHKKPILKHSTTDTDLTEILRMTAERLQDGHRSARRQTLMVPFRASGKAARDGRRGGRYESRGSVVIASASYEPSSGEVSPAKSHKSAPATLGYAELEGYSSSQSPQRQTQTPRHSRQPSRLSAISVISEPDSLVASKRESLQEVRTALSSPSRAVRSAGPSPSPHGQQAAAAAAGPYSTGSSMSSALSTLYSMEEASSVRSPPAEHLRFGDEHDDDDDTPRRAAHKKLSAFDIFSGHQTAEGDGREIVSPRFRFEEDEDEKPAPLQLRRGTMGRPSGTGSLPASRATSPSKSVDTALSLPAYAMNGNDDPFTAVPAPQNPARLSKVFSSLPVELPRGDDDYDDGEEEHRRHRPAGARPMSRAGSKSTSGTPTPSPSRRHAAAGMTAAYLPSPRTILNSPTPHEHHRPTSPVFSEAGLSSVYDSYTYSHSDAGAGTGEKDEEEEDGDTSDTTPTLVRSSFSPMRQHARVSSGESSSSATHVASGGGSGRQSRVSFRTPNYEQQSQSQLRLASDGSVYSQDQTVDEYRYDDDEEDSVPPLQTRGATTTTLKSGRSVRMSAAVAELRRMNSQISVLSEAASVASTMTLPAMRGGGFSPGRQGGGGKNYLALGSAGGDGSPARSDAASPRRVQKQRPGSPVRRVSKVRRTTSRRGTVAGLPASFDAKMNKLDETPGSVPRVGSPGKLRLADVGRAGQLLTHATRLRHQDTKRASVESLYDQQGFLKA
ncbi:hypothetical protein GGR52DRAFT_592155 [Hypoxylon sp. FL1284]|nr:hypothetical protein GGR52DRAFT_592155 [Hypoxylon sp. FL1284]